MNFRRNGPEGFYNRNGVCFHTQMAVNSSEVLLLKHSTWVCHQQFLYRASKNYSETHCKMYFISCGMFLKLDIKMCYLIINRCTSEGSFSQLALHICGIFCRFLIRFSYKVSFISRLCCILSSLHCK